MQKVFRNNLEEYFAVLLLEKAEVEAEVGEEAFEVVVLGLVVLG